jgi:PEP-CTERM motif
LNNYAIVSVGPNSSIKVNSGPQVGNVLLGDGNVSSSSGGGNGQVTGHVDVSPPATGDFLAHIQIAPTINTVASSVGVNAFNDAVALSNSASALAPTQTFGDVTGALTINGNGGLNVIDITSLHNPDLTINGGSNDNFVFNISGNFQTNHVMTLNGVNASQILFNMTGTSGNIFQTSGGDVLFGTFLATHGGDFQFSNLDLTGQLINTAGHMEIVSGSQVTVPEPNTFGLIGIGAIALSFVRNRFRRGLR